MPGAIIALDQDRPGPSTSAGTPGVSRNDLWANQVLRPRCTTSGNTSFAWSLLDAPVGSNTTVTSADQLACALTPDLEGSYRLKLVTNGGGPGNVTVMTFRVRYDVAGALALRGWALPALGEVPAEDNYPVGMGFNTRGWAEALEYILNDISAHSVLFSGSPVQGNVAYFNGTQWALLAPGTAGQVLRTAGASANPAWTDTIKKHEIPLFSGIASTKLLNGGTSKQGVFFRMGGRKVDLSAFPVTIGTLTRSVTFVADLDMTAGATTAEVKLVDTTDAVDVTGADLTSNSVTNAEVTSAALTVGSSAGDLRSDAVKQYQVYLKMNGGTDGTDDAYCTNARLVITYA